MRGAIVGPQPVAVEAGAKVLMAGGNAFDAAVTCAFVQGVVDPQMCGVGGYMLVTAHVAGSGQAMGFDAPAVAGSRVTPDMWVDKVIRLNPDGWGYFLRGKLNDVGYTSICTPGWVRGMAALLERYGTISWADAIAPAIEVAEQGHVVGETKANGWRRKAAYPEASSLLDYIQSNAEARRIYLKENGEPYDMGEVHRNPDFGKTLRRLAEAGPEDFYTGELAATMAADIEANGGFVTAEDLATYRLRENWLVRGTYRGHEIVSATAPHGGPTLIAILNILEGYDLAKLDHNSPEYIYLVAMAMKAAFADRNAYLADPDFVDVPVEWMISKERAAYWRERIDSGEPIDAAAVPTGTPTTTHVSVLDEAGNFVALTHSLGASSGVITPGLGFMYNNSMINFDPMPGNPNSIAPRKGRTTGMTPTVVYRDGKPVMVLGSPGATRIITSNLQVILNVLDFGMSLTDAVHAPRFDCQIGDIRCHARIPEYVCAEVRKRHPIVRIPRSHGGFALVQALSRDPDSGTVQGASDTGADGMALFV
jgi:gamma-glutamyltranspeptidase/glutathione hydrolase